MRPEFTTGQLATEDLFLVAMIDVGWGDAIYLQAPDGTNTQIDAGHPQDGQVVREFFERHDIESLDFASLSHVHEDHIGGFYGDEFNDLDGLFQINSTGSPNSAIPLRNAFLDIEDKTLTNGPYSNLEDALDAHLTSEQRVLLEYGESSDTNDVLKWGEGLRVDLLSAGRKPFLIPDFIADEEPGSVINNDSMIYRVQYGNFVAILTGDGEFASEQFLQNHYSKDLLRAAVLKLGHHGSNDANSERFIDFVEPIIGLIPNAIRENPGVEHPFVLNRLRNRSIDYYASDRVVPNRDRALPGVRGDVLVWTDGNGFTVEVENVRFE
jgi:competence protein ComEC